MKKLITAIAVSTAITACTPAEENIKIDTNFAELDEDQNGYLTERETESHAIASYFEKMDVDLNKRISVNEFNDYLTTTPEVFNEDIQTAAAVELEQDDNREELGNTDTVRDNMNRDDDNELKNTEEFMPKSDDELIASSEFDMMDTDRNGEVSKSEAARSGLVEEFSRVDTNNDQLITMVEYSEYQSKGQDSKGE